MARAFVCDRCGQLYNGSPASNLSIENGINTRYVVDNAKVLNKTVGVQSVELCKDCTESFRWFWMTIDKVGVK